MSAEGQKRISALSLFQPSLAHAFEEFGHGRWRVGHIPLDPRKGESRMPFVDPLDSRARLIHPIDFSAIIHCRGV